MLLLLKIILASVTLFENHAKKMAFTRFNVIKNQSYYGLKNMSVFEQDVQYFFNYR